MDIKRGVQEKLPKSNGSEEIRDKILEKALTVFAEKGYSATSMQDIAAAAGISRGPLYYYYADKADLFYSVFSNSSKQMEQIVEDIFSSQSTFFEKMEKELYTFLNKEYRDGERIREIIRSSPESHPESYQYLINSRKVVRYIKIHSAKQAINKGELRPDTDPDKLTDLMFVFLRGIVSERAFWDDSEQEKNVKILIDELMTMLESRYAFNSEEKD